MKKCYQILFTIFFILAAEAIFAQDIQQPVRFAAGNFITGNTVSKQGFSKDDLASSLYANDYFVLVQFNTLPSLSIQKELNAEVDLNEVKEKLKKTLSLEIYNLILLFLT